MVCIGFSTARGVVGTFIRWVMKSDISHSFVIFEMMGRDWVLEAGLTGVVVVPMHKWRQLNKLVDVFPVYSENMEDAVADALDSLGTPYDFGGFFGFIWPIIGKWFKLTLKNPWASSKATICSELAARVLQKAKYPNSETLDPENITPENLRSFLRR